MFKYVPDDAILKTAGDKQFHSVETHAVVVLAVAVDVVDTHIHSSNFAVE